MSVQRIIPVLVYKFTRKFTKGSLKGIDHNDTMTFVSVDAAEEWYTGVNANKKLNCSPS